MGRSTIDIFASNIQQDRTNFIGRNNSLNEGGCFKWHVPVGMEILLPQSPTPQRRSSGLPKSIDPLKLEPWLLTLFPIPTEPDIDSYATQLTDALSLSTTSHTRHRQRPWFTAACRWPRKLSSEHTYSRKNTRA